MKRKKSESLGRFRKNSPIDPPVVESEEDKRFREYIKRQKRLVKKYAKFKGNESLDPNFENSIYCWVSDE